MGCPFQIVGADNASSIMIRDQPRRGAEISKSCISIFVCCLTKKFCIEAVSALPSQSLLPPVVVFNKGTNFVSGWNLGQMLERFKVEIVNLYLNGKI